jgi:muramoyltetrapeptide carboxypeptidase
MWRCFLISFLFNISLFSEALLPPALQKGDLIAIVFPASFLKQEEADSLFSKAQWLQLQGYRTLFYPSKIHRLGYLAGTDSERAAALMDAWKSEEVKAIWCFRGGYGSQRILEYLDYDYIQAHPKIFIGMSDITALHQAITQRTQLITFLGPVLSYFGPDKQEENRESFCSCEELLMQGKLTTSHTNSLETITPGKAQGALIGGNLSIIAGLCGTQWQLRTEGKVLILEDVNEGIYCIDRKLWQLKAAGLLDKPAAVILGEFVNCKPLTEYSLTLDQVFENYFKEAPYPVIKGFPSGHTDYQVTLPLNARIEVDATLKKVSLLQEVVHLF